MILSNDFKKRFLKTGVLLLLLPQAFAARAQEEHQRLDSVTVNGGRVALTLNRSARIVTLLDSIAIAPLAADNVNDLLKYSAATDVRQRGAFGMQTDISVRGGTSDQIAVLLNGIDISDPQTGHNAADFPVNLDDIDRIEILEGPASRVYGASSLLGAVNVVTRFMPSKSLRARVEGGSFGYFNGGVTASLGGRRFSNQLSASYVRSDGFQRNSAGNLNSDFRTGKVFYQGSFRSMPVDLDYQAGMSIKDFGAGNFYSSRFDDQFEHTMKTFVSVKARTKGFVQFMPAIYWNRAVDKFELFRGRPDLYPFNHHVTNVAGMNLNGQFSTVAGKTAFGLEIRNENIRSTNLGEPLDDVKGDLRCGLNRTNFSLLLEHNYINRNFTASAGFNLTKNTGNNEGVKIYPGIDLSYRFANWWKLYASANSSYRMPTFTELYYSVGGHQADKNLKAEKMLAFELGLKFLRPGINAVASIYYHRGTDLIDWIRDTSLGEDAPWTSVNHAKVNALGQEITVDFRIAELLSRSDFFIQSAGISYSHISQDSRQEEGIQSAYTMEYLRHKLVGRLDFKIINGLTLNVSCRFQDRVGSSLYKPYALIDSKLVWSQKRYEIYVKGNNLLNTRYYDYHEIPQPGIWAMGGVVIKI